ncbi:MAG: oxidoreductase [Myxococcota bacterium]
MSTDTTTPATPVVTDTPPETVEAPTRKVRTYEVMVKSVTPETHDAVTITLFAGNERLDYKPGQFLTINPHQFGELARFAQFLADQKGSKEPIRAYSVSSAPHEQYLSFTVKEESYVSGVTPYPPLLSPLLVRGLNQGRVMQVSGFSGPYTIPDDITSKTDHLIHICAGSGIVPNFSMIKDQLHRNTKLRHTLVYGNKTYDDIIYRQQLDTLQRQFPFKLRVVHVLSREANAERFGIGFRSGRVSAAVLKEVIEEPTAAQVFACGPGVTKWERSAAKKEGRTPTPRFLEGVMEALQQLGVPKKNVHQESYG